VVIEENERGPKPKDLYGTQTDLCARVMGLAEGGQILLTGTVFDSARQALKGEDIAGVKELSWLNHGPYLLKGIEESVEVCEVGEAGIRVLKRRSDQRKLSARSLPVSQCWAGGGGRAAGSEYRWLLEKKLGEGGFGEVWLGRHQTMKERRVFKFCFRADRVRSLKREMTLFQLIKERIGDHQHRRAARSFISTPRRSTS
jgi:serine/threonine-protein kinase